ncbi:MAG: DUF692 domain-containing protein [Betaproteobacteria bacterium]|nr:DUF692 domain-containing protein [Betaproteobacteria bacterium]
MVKSKTGLDRVGIGWRGELAAGIFTHLDQIDLLEIIADAYFKSDARALRPLQTLAAQVPITLHGVSMGLAGSEAVELWRMDNMARLVNTLQPESWSEHLAFVRAGGIEIGHLAAPPRTDLNICAAIANIERVSEIVGQRPLMENIATLIDPPGSRWDEPGWTAQIVNACGEGLLLDLHNLYDNALNFGDKPEKLLMRFPLHRVREVHLSGGKWIDEPSISKEQPSTRQRLLDDHVHDVPGDVFGLLELLAQHVAQPLDVIIERDGLYPDFDHLVTQMDAARTALARGRASTAMMKAAA